MTLERTTAIGRAFEEAACEHLATEGYRLVSRNYRAPGGEIDIVAWDGDILCFVEVRGRSADHFGDPLETISRTKIARIIRAAHWFLTDLPRPWPVMRFDVIGLTGSPPAEIRLIRDAFDDSRVGS
ncbi:MAG: YraN family protein [Myxococcota bacterium]|nr:YraN family protein [Myxococcota bacterium]